MSTIRGLVAASIEAWGTTLVERAVFGTDDPAAIEQSLDRFCRAQLGAGVGTGRFYAASTGCVFGVELDDARVVVVKAYQARWRPEFLATVQRVQRRLADEGFPCPAPVRGPARLVRGWGVIEELLPDPGQFPLEEGMMAVSAAGLAVQVQLSRGVDGSGLLAHPMSAPAGNLYPEPHSPVFDFTATSAGAEWIDSLMLRAKQARLREDPPRVIAHTDWSVRNVRLGPDRVLAAYDWDSLAFVPEPAAAGQAAATWSAFGEQGEGLMPSAVDVARYVRHYEVVRGEPFSSKQRALAGAAALDVLAYTARCEHAADPTGTGGRARPRLAQEADALLQLADLMEAAI